MPIPMNEVEHVEVNMKGLITGGGSDAVRTNFVFHFRRTAVAIDPTKTAINTAFQTAISNVIDDALNVDWSATTNSIRYIDDALDAPVDFANASVGVITGDRLASFCTAFLLMRTSLRGQNYRGSKRLGPFSESDITHADGCDIFNAAAVTRLEAIATAILNGFTDATTNVWVPCVLSRELSVLASNPTIVQTADVTQVLVNQRVGTDTRRKAASIYG